MRIRPLLLLALFLLLPLTPQAGRISDLVSMEVDATGPVVFSHYRHLEKLGNNCVHCHNSIFHILRAQNPRVSMKEMAEGKSCGACHNGRKAFGVDSNCNRCHPTREVKFPVEDVGEVLFNHQVHTALFGCGDCHPDLFRPASGNPQVSMSQMEEGLSCGACHDGSGAFSVAENCERCHAM